MTDPPSSTNPPFSTDPPSSATSPDTGGPETYSIDLHSHTRFFHGFTSRPTPFDPWGARLLAAFARRRGLDAVAVTNHDYRYLPERSPDGLAFVPGIEVSTTRGHVLVVGPDPPEFTVPNTLTPRETVDIAHDAGCAAVIAHPYRRSTVAETTARFDAVEINGKHPRRFDAVRELADERDLPVVGGSDAHYPVEVGRAYTRVEADDLTAASVAAAVREGRVEPEVEGGVVDRTVRRGYRLLHDRKENDPAGPRDQTVGDGQ